MSVCLTNQKIKEKSREKFDLLLFSILFLLPFCPLSNLFQRKATQLLINLSNLIDILKESVDLKEKGKKTQEKLQLKIN